MTSPFVFRLALDRNRSDVRPGVALGALDRSRQAEEFTWRRAQETELARLHAAEAPWVEAETFVLEHSRHSEIVLDEQAIENAANAELLDRIALRLICRSCPAQLERAVIPTQAVAAESLREPADQVRSDLLAVVETYRRPSSVQEALIAGYRRLEVEDFAHRHRQHGGLRVGEGARSRPVLWHEQASAESVGQVWVLCACGNTTSWSADTPEDVTALLVELRALIEGHPSDPPARSS